MRYDGISEGEEGQGRAIGQRTSVSKKDDPRLSTLYAYPGISLSQYTGLDTRDLH